MDYGMYTLQGNAAVHAIVVVAKTIGLSEIQVMAALKALEKSDDVFGEANDTVVRECVGCALGFYE